MFGVTDVIWFSCVKMISGSKYEVQYTGGSSSWCSNADVRVQTVTQQRPPPTTLKHRLASACTV